MKTPRITIRALMIVVALAALASFGWVLRQRSGRFAAEAFRHYCKMGSYLARRDSIITDQHDGTRLLPEELVGWQKDNIEFFERGAAYEEQLIRKYRWAAIFPWGSPGEDPPPPTPSHR